MPILGTLNDSKMNIPRINAYHGNASAALVCDGKLVAAVEEEALQSREICRGLSRRGDSLLPKEAGNHPWRSRSRRRAA